MSDQTLSATPVHTRPLPERFRTLTDCRKWQVGTGKLMQISNLQHRSYILCDVIQTGHLISLKDPCPTFGKKLAKKSLDDPRTTCERINETSSAYPLLPYRKS